MEIEQFLPSSIEMAAGAARTPRNHLEARGIEKLS